MQNQEKVFELPYVEVIHVLTVLFNDMIWRLYVFVPFPLLFNLV